MKLNALFPVIFPKLSTQEQLVLSCLLSPESWQQPRKWVTLWVNRHFLFMGCHGKGWLQGWKTRECLISELMRCPPVVSPILDFLKSHTKPSQSTYQCMCIHTHTCLFIQLILIHRFHIFEFAYILKCLCNLHISTHSTSMVFVDMCRVVKKSHLLVEVNRDDTAFCSSSVWAQVSFLSICLVPCFMHACGFTL